VVIDSDLGQSSASAADRERFQRLVSEVVGREGTRSRSQAKPIFIYLDGRASRAPWRVAAKKIRKPVSGINVSDGPSTPKKSAPQVKAHDAGHDAIARLAYELWVGRGRPDGSPERDWYDAERILNEARSHKSKSMAASG